MRVVAAPHGVYVDGREIRVAARDIPTAEESALALRLANTIKALDGVRHPVLFRAKVENLRQTCHAALAFLTERNLTKFGPIRALVNDLVALEREIEEV